MVVDQVGEESDDGDIRDWQWVDGPLSVIHPVLKDPRPVACQHSNVEEVVVLLGAEDQEHGETVGGVVGGVSCGGGGLWC